MCVCVCVRESVCLRHDGDVVCNLYSRVLLRSLSASLSLPSPFIVFLFVVVAISLMFSVCNTCVLSFVV